MRPGLLYVHTILLAMDILVYVKLKKMTQQTVNSALPVLLAMDILDVNLKKSKKKYMANIYLCYKHLSLLTKLSMRTGLLSVKTFTFFPDPLMGNAYRL